MHSAVHVVLHSLSNEMTVGRKNCLLEGRNQEESGLEVSSPPVFLLSFASVLLPLRNVRLIRLVTFSVHFMALSRLWKVGSFGASACKRR